MLKSDFLGIWKLISFSIESQDGVSYPYGKEAIGYIIYTSDDIVSVHMMSVPRMKESQYQFQLGTDIEKIEAADNFGGYVGRYEVNGNEITHFPEICGFPSFLNVPQKRQAQLLGNTLVLSCIDSNSRNESTIVWERVDGKA